jgi:chromosome segregation ATPase
MAGRKPRASPERQPSRSAHGRTQLLLEEIQSQNRATIEAVWSFRAELSGQIASFEERLSTRLEGVESAVTNLAGRTTSLESAVDKLAVRTTSLESAVDKLAVRTTSLESAVDKLAVRATSVEATLERMDAKLDRKTETETTDALEARVRSLEPPSRA